MIRIILWVVRRISGQLDFISNNGIRAYAAEILRRLFHADAIASFLLTSTHSRPDRIYKKLARINEDQLNRIKVTVVIPVLNGVADGLERLLVSLAQQTHRNLDIVAVDSGSTDSSVELLEKYGAKVVKIPKEKFRHDYSRNLGAQHATGEYLLFTVCDACFDDPQWIDLGLRHLLYFGGVSYSTPQRYDQAAEPYARYLAYTFIAVNKYSVGTSVFGNRVVGGLAWRLGRAWFREKVIHVDDTNHLVSRRFFERAKFTRLTCEDMEFGAKVIRSNRKFVYSTLSYIKHFHSYRNYGKYFDRVYVDLMVIQDLLGSPFGANRPGIVDTVVVTATLVLGHILQTISRYEKLGASTVAVLAGRRDLVDTSLERDVLTVRGARILSDLDQRLRAVDEASFVLDITQQDPEAVGIICDQLKLRVNAIEHPRDIRRFVDFRDRLVMHLRVSTDILSTRLGYDDLSIEEFRRFIVLCFINFLAAELSRLAFQYRDSMSENRKVLDSLRWR